MRVDITGRKRMYMSGKKRREIWEKFNKKCQICGKETVLFKCNAPFYSDRVSCAVDHIKPFSKGGECIIENFQLLCECCNAQKRDKYDPCN